ncbi:hypothetical protein ES703_19143 [subsurface metagenome]
MKEIDGIKYFEGWDTFRKIKTRAPHSCALCNDKIEWRNFCFKYIEKETGWEKYACLKHLNNEIIEQFEIKRSEYEKRFNRGERITLATDASGPDGCRWAFVAYYGKTISEFEEIDRKHGYTPSHINAITPAEGYAILKAVEWLEEAEKKEIIPEDMPIMVGSDNFAVTTKLRTQSERGKYMKLWKKLNEALLPYRVRLFIRVSSKGLYEADRYCQKWSLEKDKKGS